MATTDPTYSLSRLAERADERLRALRQLDGLPLEAAPLARDGLAARVRASLKALWACLPKLRLQTMASGAMPSPHSSGGVREYACAPSPRRVPSPPDILFPPGLAGLAKIKTTHVEQAKPFAAAHRPFKPLDADTYREHLAVKGMQPGVGAATQTAHQQRHTSVWPRRILRWTKAVIWLTGGVLKIAFVGLIGGLSAVTSGILAAAGWLRGRTSGTASRWDGVQSAFSRFLLMAATRLSGWRQRVTGGSSGTPGAIMPAAVPFQPDLDEIIEEPAPQAMRSLHYFVVALVVALVLIAALVDVEIVVQGSGQLTTEIPPIVLQPMERAIIRDIKVKVGDVVKKGQVLASLDPTFSDADVESLNVQNRSLSAQLRRIEAEMTGTPFTILNLSDPNELLQAEIYNQRQSQYAARLSAFDEEINRWKGNMQATSEDRAFLAQQLGIANEVEAMRTKLWLGRLTSKLQYLDSQNTRLRFQRDHQSAVDKLTELQHNLQGKRADRQAFVDEWRRQLLEDLLGKRTELAKVNEALSKATRMHDLVLLTAPADGVVLTVARLSIGSVLREAEPLVTLVPSNATLIAEIMVSSGDIGYALPGDRVVVKVDAFPYQRHGPMEGRLLTIGEESFNPGSHGADGTPSVSGAQHRARIALTHTGLENMPDNARLIPGMTLSAEIKVGKRSVISYFLYPITRGFGESIREP